MNMRCGSWYKNALHLGAERWGREVRGKIEGKGEVRGEGGGRAAGEELELMKSKE